MTFHKRQFLLVVSAALPHWFIVFQKKLLSGARVLEAIHILHHVRGWGGSLSFVTKCDNVWVGCFWCVM